MALVLSTVRASSLSVRLFRQGALVTALIGLAVVIYYLARYILVLVLFSSIVGNHNVSEDSVKNGRGDEATASTEASGNWGDPDKTVIRLRRAHNWFWTTLVEAESFGVREKLNWRNDDALDVMLGFGCLKNATHQGREGRFNTRLLSFQ